MPKAHFLTLSQWGQKSNTLIPLIRSDVVQIVTDLDSHDLRYVDLNQVHENRFSTLYFDNCESLCNPFEASLTLAKA